MKIAELIRRQVVRHFFSALRAMLNSMSTTLCTYIIFGAFIILKIPLRNRAAGSITSAEMLVIIEWSLLVVPVKQGSPLSSNRLSAGMISIVSNHSL